jgi:4-amino-4-deoxy-L-arabinose transferase-like glycosyltransferase
LKPYLILTALCLALFLPGIAAMPPIDRDESRFAQASKQMVESGDYIRIQFQGESRAKKPAGIYWLQAASAKLTGATDAIWAYRIPSVLGALAAVLLLFGLSRRLVGDKAALFAASLLASCFLLVSEAHQAKTDAVQLAAVVAAQCVLMRLYIEHRLSWGMAALFWLAQAIGILIKGPIVPMISLLTIIPLCIADRGAGWLKSLRPLPGLVLVAAMVGPWAWAISHATQGQFIGNAVKNDLFAKLLGAQESHGGLPGTYALLALFTLWPASLFVGFALPGVWRNRKVPLIRFLIAWIVPSWLLFELIPTKLPHYILPVYPALVLLAGIWLSNPGRRDWHKWFAGAWSLVALALAAAVLLANPLMRLPMQWAYAGLSAAILIFAVIAAARYAVDAAVLLAIVAFGGIFTWVLPNLEPMWVSRALDAAIPAGAPLAAAGFHEPSLVFLHGTDTLLADAAGAADFLKDHPNGWAAIEAAAAPDFQAQADKDELTLEKAGEVDGFNYSRGRPARITLYRLKGTAY